MMHVTGSEQVEKAWLHSPQGLLGTPVQFLINAIIYSSVSQPCSWRHTNTAHILCLPNLKHLIQLISSLTHLIMS